MFRLLTALMLLVAVLVCVPDANAHGRSNFRGYSSGVRLGFNGYGYRSPFLGYSVPAPFNGYGYSSQGFIGYTQPYYQPVPLSVPVFNYGTNCNQGFSGYSGFGY
jgi:hypothetical protein